MAVSLYRLEGETVYNQRRNPAQMDYTKEIDFTEMLAGYDATVHAQEGYTRSPGCIYELYHVSSHQGGAGGGHWIACTRTENPDDPSKPDSDMWLYISDSGVSGTTKKYCVDHHHGGGSIPQLLFYRKKHLDLEQECTLPTPPRAEP
jgi:hypothetical protein